MKYTILLAKEDLINLRQYALGYNNHDLAGYINTQLQRINLAEVWILGRAKQAKHYTSEEKYGRNKQ
jgi:hypothetical protein